MRVSQIDDVAANAIDHIIQHRPPLRQTRAAAAGVDDIRTCVM